MISRYSLKEMQDLWSLENKFKVWLDIEIHACEAHVKLGNMPAKALDVIKKKAGFSVKRIDMLEKKLRHDVIAFLTCVSEKVGPESRFVHMGLTSSDVVDTAMCHLMKQAGEKVLEKLDILLKVLKNKAKRHRKTPCMGRTHGVHAEPTTFGLKVALWYAEMERNRERLVNAIETISVGKISGAVGTHAHMSPKVEEYVCRKMGLRPAPISTQIIQRDRHAEYLAVMGIIASSIDKIALEIRHLQRTEVLEAEEYFASGQKGSSAMPHKRNPVNCEQMCGLARVVRGNVQAAMENVALWHERDISHSSTERVIVPDSTILVHYMLDKTAKIVDSLLVYPDRMLKNMEASYGLFYSQRVLLALVKSGMTREAAYGTVQARAMQAWKEKRPFRELLMEDAEVSKRLDKRMIEEIFDLHYYLKNVDDIFKRVFDRKGGMKRGKAGKNLRG